MLHGLDIIEAYFSLSCCLLHCFYFHIYRHILFMEGREYIILRTEEK